MKKIFPLLLLLVVLTGSLNAQTVTKSKLLGRWKATALDLDGHRYSFTDKNALMQGFVAAKGGDFSKEDSVLVAALSDLLISTLGNMVFEFRSNDTAYVTMETTVHGKTKTESDHQYYTISNNKLVIDVEPGKQETIPVAMPNTQTLVFENFDAAVGKSVVFTRQ